MTTLQQAQILTTEILKEIVLDQDNFPFILETSFGSDYDLFTAEQIFGQWQLGNFNNLPTVTILSADDMFGAEGAYDTNANQVYLSQSLIDTENFSLITSVLLEEYGHFIDAQINLDDTAGDEGAVFSLLARGEDISPELLISLQNKDDSGFVSIDGQLMEVENAALILNVTTTFDQNDGSAQNGLSLRDAIIIANNNPTAEYEIVLQAGQTYTLTKNGSDDTAIAGDLDILGNVTVKTQGVGQSPATIDARGLSQRDKVFYVLRNATLTLENIIVTGGFSNIDGGGIYVDGNLNVFSSTIDGNTAERSGGGIYVNSFSSVVNIINSTISNNTSLNQFGAGGGGLFFRGNSLIANSTISGNTAFNSGGGVYTSSGEIVITNTTIANNTADTNRSNSGDGGGIYRSSGNVSVRNTIIAGNRDLSANNSNIHPDVSRDIDGNNNNLIGDLRGASGTIGTGTDIVSSNIRLAPLGNYGGLTKTHGLYQGSPAINAGNSNLIPSDTLDLDNDGITDEFTSFDQRGVGFPRVLDNQVNIGAVEGALPPATVETPIYRFQNSSVPGTYLFVGEQERQSIKANFPNFVEEGFAFRVSDSLGDGLIALNRFQNTSVPGTYLFAGEAESINIRNNFRNFVEEGVAFYVYAPGSGEGTSYNRFQNTGLPGTYLFAGPEESNGIIQNFPTFVNEGIAFGAG